MAINNDLLGAKYQKPRNWITERIQDGTPWEELVSHPTSLPTAQFLNVMVQVDKWPVISSEEWEVLVRQQKEAEEKAVSLDIKTGQALVIDGTSNNDVTLPVNEHTCWQLYKSKLEKDGFSSQAIDEIERATLKILRRMSEDTRSLGPIKGLVIGNVQSGKTANMAALMAMAADWGWNMFIILSGTIENLRIQTQDRLWNDLNNSGCNLYWNSLEHLSVKSPPGSRAQDLRFESDAKQRYFSVTLKNATRLKSLIRWLQKDKFKMQQMKILVIDDEADQAGINTAPVSNAERKKINKLICSLANGWDAEGRTIKERYLAMNYVGYTATPYANILNESSVESLYPRNFIATLSVSDQYFGPQQVFGCPETQFRGLDIIRNVSDDDLSEIKEIHKGKSINLPDSIKDALCWFVCSVAAIRKTGSKKPISMLIHTSQRVQHHANVSGLIRNWVNHEDRNALMERCKRVWSDETVRFSREEFLEQYPGYGLADKVNDYPSFDSIESVIRDILSIELKPIKLNEEGEMKYHKGIHLCVDNSANNGRNDENEYLRLVYPKKDVVLDKAPAFLVIGGATLSRGLTLEGLVCTFFLRSVKQADTLMQMGRWFGYRKGYELYPRLWITDTTRLQFEYLSILDQELREEIRNMEILGQLPTQYAARVRNSPRLNLIRITAKNRMQNAVAAEMDYSGSFNQTYLFDEKADVLQFNLELGKKFIEGLGDPCPKKECNSHASNAVIWDNVSNSRVEEFLKSFRFCQKLSVFNDITPLLDWIREITAKGQLTPWNVVLAGKKKATEGEMWSLSNCSVSKVTRTRKKTENEIAGIINIGALRAPADIIADVDLEGQPQEFIDLFNKREESRMKEIRMKAGLSSTPQLIVYIVDKDSMPNVGSSSRKPLQAPCDLIGLCVNIPGGVAGANYVAKVCIRLEPEFADNGDLDGENTEEQ